MMYDDNLERETEKEVDEVRGEREESPTVLCSQTFNQPEVSDETGEMGKETKEKGHKMPKFLEYNSVYIDIDFPEVPEMLRCSSIERLSINTAGDDTDNSGPCYLWVTTKSGEATPIFEGTIDEVKNRYNEVRAIIK